MCRSEEHASSMPLGGAGDPSYVQLMSGIVSSTAGPEKLALKQLSARSDLRGLAQLGSHLAVLAVTAALVLASRGSLALLPAMLLHGIVLIFLFAPLHETIHWTAFRSRPLNDLVAWVCGAVLVLPPLYFRCFHFAHHRYTQDPQRDPELAMPKPDSLGRYLLHVSGLPYWRDRLATTLAHAKGEVAEGFVPARQRDAVAREALGLLGLYVLIALGSLLAGSWLAVELWLAPALLGQPFLRLYLLAEHTLCPLVPDMLANSRTTRSNLLLRRLAWNMPYHAEHHAFPALPFHALPRAHALLGARISVQSPGYLAVHREILSRLGT